LIKKKKNKGDFMTDEKTELEVREEKKLGAKQYSLFAQIFSGAWIAVHTILKGMGIMTLDMTDIIYSGIAIAAIFMPVYFSIFLDKIRDIKFLSK
jgi:hypothetical protein